MKSKGKHYSGSNFRVHTYPLAFVETAVALSFLLNAITLAYTVRLSNQVNQLKQQENRHELIR